MHKICQATVFKLEKHTQISIKYACINFNDFFFDRLNIKRECVLGTRLKLHIKNNEILGT